MRSFQIISLLIFIIFYGLITIGAFQNIKTTVNGKYRQKVVWFFWVYTVLLIFSFIYLYIYPNEPKGATNYVLYFFYNTILFIDVVVKIPLSITFLFYLFFSRKNKSKTILFSGLILSFCLATLIIYGTILGNQNIKVNQVELNFSNLPPNFSQYKIVQISDIHLGSLLEFSNLLEKTAININKINPDLILFSGDLVNNFSNETIRWENTFNDINAKGNSFSILGNHDYGNYSRWPDEESKQNNFEGIIKSHKKLGFTLLRNENVVIKMGNDSIFLIGVENWGHPPFPQYANLDSAMFNIPENAFKILMTHDPAHWEAQIAGKKKIELTVSGHTHGLQLGIKPAGIPFSLAYLTRKNWSGLYQSDNSYLYVNTGLGTVGIPWRIDMPPEITVFTLKGIEIE